MSSARAWTWLAPTGAPTVTGTAVGRVAEEAYGYSRNQSFLPEPRDWTLPTAWPVSGSSTVKAPSETYLSAPAGAWNKLNLSPLSQSVDMPSLTVRVSPGVANTSKVPTAGALISASCTDAHCTNAGRRAARATILYNFVVLRIVCKYTQKRGEFKDAQPEAPSSGDGSPRERASGADRRAWPRSGCGPR